MSEAQFIDALPFSLCVSEDPQTKTIVRGADLSLTALQAIRRIIAEEIAKVPAVPPETKHNGQLDDRDAVHLTHAAVKLEHNFPDMGTFIWIHGGHGDCESNAIHLDPGQALSLLFWLEQKRALLESLAAEEGAIT